MVTNYPALLKKIQENPVLQDRVLQKIIKEMVSKLETKLSQPDDVIIEYMDATSDMYIIAKGECSVAIVDEKKKTHNNHRILRSGDYFGEISMIYGCRRTATVSSRKYTTLALLTRAKYKEIVTEFPELVGQLKEGIYKYNDRMKKFMKDSINRIEYFQNVNDDAIHDVLYNMETETMPAGSLLFEPGDETKEMLLIQDGVIEVYTSFENHTFVIERLYRGSILNFRNFYLGDTTMCYYKFVKNSIIQTITLDKLSKVCSKHKKLEDQFLQYHKKNLFEKRQFPLDFVINLPKLMKGKKLITKAEQTKVMQIRVIFKNVVMQRIGEVRQAKQRLSLKDMIMESLKKKNQKDEKIRIQIKKKVLEMYELQAANVLEDNDVWFNRIIANVDRLLKILTAQTTAIDSLERKLNALTRKQPVMPKITKQKTKHNNKAHDISRGSLDTINSGDSKDFMTLTMGKFPRIEDDSFSESSDEERQKRERLEKLSKIANMPKDVNLLKEYRLPIMTAHTNMKFDVDDSSEEDPDDDDEDKDDNDD